MIESPKMKVLDTSGVLRSNLDFSDRSYCVPNSVIQELKDEKSKLMIDLSIERGSIRVIDPTESSIKKVIKTAQMTGDIQNLSQTDIDVIALALEHDLDIVTDDYSIQNVANALGLKHEPIAQEGIKYKFRWINICEGCGRKYPSDFDGVCEICGSGLRRKVIEKEKIRKR